MPKILEIRPFNPDSNFSKERYITECIEETRVHLLKDLENVNSIQNRTFQLVCMFSMIDSLSQEYSNYPTFGSQRTFCDFVLRFQNRYDFLKLVEPVTLFYEYEPRINKVVYNQKLHQLYPDEFPEELEVDIEDIPHLDDTSVDKILKCGKANEILDLIEKQDGKEKSQKMANDHLFINLLYRMRCKAVHELTHLGEEHQWDIKNGKSLPFYRSVTRGYVKDNQLIYDSIYELVIPNKFVYDLAYNCINNYLDFCLSELRMPFKNNQWPYREVFLTWNDRK